MDFLDMLKITTVVASSFLTISAFISMVIGYKAKAKGGFKKIVRDLVGIDNVLGELRENCEKLNTQIEISLKLQDAVLSVLRRDLKELCEDCLLRGYITSEEFELIAQMFETYVALGGNSFIHNLVAKAKRLPVKIDD